MKTLPITIIFLSFFILNGQAQKLHALIFADTQAADVGTGCKKNFDRMTQLVREIEDNTALRLHPYFFEGEDCTPQNLKKSLNSLDVGVQDVVIFYYAGHGVANPRSSWPDLRFNQGGKALNLKEIEETIAALKPKNQLVIGECCNKKNDALAWEHSLQSRGGLKFKARYQELFATEGRVLICASEKGNVAYVNPEEGGIFMNAFHQQLEKSLSQSKPVHWDEVLFNVDLTMSGLDIRIQGQVQSPPPTPRYEGYQIVNNQRRSISMIGK